MFPRVYKEPFSLLHILYETQVAIKWNLKIQIRHYFHTFQLCLARVILCVAESRAKYHEVSVKRLELKQKISTNRFYY